MNEMDQTVSFVEGQRCPLPIAGHGGGLSFSPNGDMLLLAAISMCIASELTYKISPNILIIHQKIFGLLLGAIAIEFVIEGLKATFPILV